MSKSDCRKFSPNIFNKQKCASCFKHKEEHSAEALDSNRASRKVQRCGFLFVAPDWDFSNPINRTKRWQRRWFVLYDDGELTYSVDDHPETVPHGVIDMAKVIEVADAEEVTGNNYSLALTASDRVTFIKATCREESRWWMDALTVYTTMVKGRHKRNATFPGGGRSTTVNSPSALNGSGPEPFQTPPAGRRRLHSCQSEPLRRILPPTALTGAPSVTAGSPQREPPPPPPAQERVSPARERSTPPVEEEEEGQEEEEDQLKENRPPASEPVAIPTSVDDKYHLNPPTSESPPTQDRSRTTRRLNKQSRSRQGLRGRSDTISEMLQTSTKFLSEEKQPTPMIDSLAAPDLNVTSRPGSLLTSNGKKDGSSGSYLSDYSSRREEKLKNIADSLTRPRPTRTLSYLRSIEHGQMQPGDEKPTREFDDGGGERRAASCPVDSDVIDAASHVRGDPDGCGLDATDGCYSNHGDLRVDLPAEDLLRMKKGWLMKKNEKGMWMKHWFVLRGTTLSLYKDTAAEDNNVLDDVIELSRAQRVEECETEKNYGFQIITWEGAAVQLTAMTSGIRGNWIQALRSAAHLPDTAHRLSLGEKLERQLSETARKPRLTTAERDTSAAAPSPQVASLSTAQVAALSSDEEYRTASETSGDGLDDSDVEEGGEGKVSRGSPPPRKTPLSRAKGRGRSRSTSSTRSSKRSRSSPPSSRRSTRDDFPRADEVSASIQTLASPAADPANTMDSPFKRSWRSGRSSLRSSLRSDSMLSDRLDARETYTNALDRSKLRSSLRTMPTEATPRGDTPSSASRELTRMRHRLDTLESEKRDAERSARRAVAAEETRSREVDEWRQRASSLEQQLSQLLLQLQRQERELAEKTEQLQQLLQLETQYSELLQRHEEVQAARAAAEDGDQWRRHYEKLEQRYLADHAEWERKLSETEHRLQEMLEEHEQHTETDRTVQRLTEQLKQAEAQMRSLADQVETAHSSRQREVDKLREDATQHQTEMTRLRAELEAQQSTRDAIKQDKSEVYKLKDLVHELRSLLEDRSQELEKQRREAREARQELAGVRQELEAVRLRLQQGIEENETLSARLRETRNNATLSSSQTLTTSRERFSSRRHLQICRIESLSDLTAGVEMEVDDMERDRLQEEYHSLRERFEKAVAEIRALKRQLRDVQGEQDKAELEAARLTSELQTRDETHTAEAVLMRERLQDLTAKLAASEKQARQLRQKLSKGDARDRRRTSSLKGRESFSIPAELETKLAALEARVAAWEGTPSTPQTLRSAPALRTPSVTAATPAGTPVSTPVKESSPPLTTEQKTTSSSPAKPSASAGAAASPAASTPAASGSDSAHARRSRSFEESTKASRMRRKSLDGVTSQDALRVIMRVNSLEARVAGRAKKSPSPPRRSPAPVRKVRARSAEQRPTSPERGAEERAGRGDLRQRLRKLEALVGQVREQLDSCVGELQAADVPQAAPVCARLAEASAQLAGQPAPAPEGVRALVERIRLLLLRKAREQAQAQQQLKAARRWTAGERRRLAAEKLAYQTVLLTCLSEALRAAAQPEPFERQLKLRELLETHRKMGTLRHRLQSGVVENVSSGMVESFSALLAERLAALEEAAVGLKPRPGRPQQGRRPQSLQQDPQLRQLHQSLLKQETEVTAAVSTFKAEKLSRLAEALAAETVLGAPPPPSDETLLEEVKIRDAWNMAQDSINEELVQAEMAHMMLKFVELYERDLEVDRQHCFFLVQSQQEAAERRYTVATESLRTEMEEAVMTLSQRYEASLARLRSSPGPPAPPGDEADRLLAELADVVAQKAIVDGYLSVMADEDLSPPEAPLERIEEDPASAEAAVPLDAALQRDSALAVFFGDGGDASDQAELQHLFSGAVERCRGELADFGVAIPVGESLDDFCRRTQQTVASVRADCDVRLQQERAQHREQIRSLEREIESLRRVRVRPRSVDKSRRRVSDITGMLASTEIQTAPLGEMRQELASLHGHQAAAPAPEAAAEPCRRCEELSTRVSTISSEHTSELKALRKVQDAELEQLRREMTAEVNKVTATYEREKEALASEVHLLRRRLESLEAEYEAQLSSLREQYESAASDGSQRPEEDTLAEESIRRRYQAEIEQLRALCEKGLVAMENSHRRIIAELEEKHRRELHSLEAEKQQALAEETQATLAALDALRKAHETEVQREICKFKDEFIKKMQPGFDLGQLQKEHVAEMGDIKGEILSLSEKYSIKCLETASLEERVDMQSRSLQQANQRVFQLDTRNKQLRAQLSANITGLQQPAESGDRQLTAAQKLALAENQLAHSREEAQRLTQELETTQKREAELSTLCRQLSTYLRAERQLRADEVSSLRDRLEHIILTASKCEGSRGSASQGGSAGSSDAEDKPRLRRGASLTSARIKELMRSPSCPRLSGMSTFLSPGGEAGRLASPLSGMVASRKKVFETSRNNVAEVPQRLSPARQK